jgi:hypothetical protein
MTQHLGLPIPSPAIFDKSGQKFRRAVASFAEANGIPWVRFARDDRKADVMALYFKRAAATGRPQVAAIGVAQEFQRVQAAYRRETGTAAAVHLRHGRPAGDLLLLLPVGRRFRPGVHQGLMLLFSSSRCGAVTAGDVPPGLRWPEGWRVAAGHRAGRPVLSDRRLRRAFAGGSGWLAI